MHRRRETQNRPTGPKILLIYYPTVALGIVIWATLARRIDKHQAWLVGMTVMAGVTVSYMLVGHGDIMLMTCILAMSGIGSGALSARCIIVLSPCGQLWHSIG